MNVIVNQIIYELNKLWMNEWMNGYTIITF